MTIVSQSLDRANHRMLRFLAVSAVILVSVSACTRTESTQQALTEAQKAEIEDEIRKVVMDTYDLTAPDVVDRLMRLYPDSGPVYSTSSGHITRTREELKEQ